MADRGYVDALSANALERCRPSLDLHPDLSRLGVVQTSEVGYMAKRGDQQMAEVDDAIVDRWDVERHRQLRGGERTAWNHDFTKVLLAHEAVPLRVVG